MPMKIGHSQNIISGNVKEMIRAGHKPKQAVAAALAMARKSKKMAEGGSVDNKPTAADKIAQGFGFDNAGPKPSNVKEGYGYEVASTGADRDSDKQGYDEGGVIAPLMNQSNVEGFEEYLKKHQKPEVKRKDEKPAKDDEPKPSYDDGGYIGHQANDSQVKGMDEGDKKGSEEEEPEEEVASGGGSGGKAGSSLMMASEGGLVDDDDDADSDYDENAQRGLNEMRIQAGFRENTVENPDFQDDDQMLARALHKKSEEEEIRLAMGGLVQDDKDPPLGNEPTEDMSDGKEDLQKEPGDEAGEHEHKLGDAVMAAIMERKKKRSYRQAR